MKKGFNIFWIFCLILIIPVMSQAFDQWPDTGQTTSYTDTFGEDSDYNINPQSYSKLGSGGVELSDTATSSDGWVMVRDNVTGLIWEIKTVDGSIHDIDNTYTWCDTNFTTNGGESGTCGTDNTEGFINTLNSDSFGGFSDWRMPTIKELSTIVNYDMADPTINTTFFPNTLSYYYWSSTTHANDTGSAWKLDFYDGQEGNDSKSSTYYIRAVRAGQSGSLDNLVDNGDGTVTDTSTGLMWQQYSPRGVMNWESAITYCEFLSLANHDDWRLPDINELLSLVDYSKYDPAIDTVFFPGVVSSDYWSSTTSVYSTRLAWLVDYYSGGSSGGGIKPNTYYVRAVRAGQSGPFVDSDIWYQDADGDGYGNPNQGMSASSQPAGYVADNTDCNDTDSTIYPSATEIAGDGVDQNCDGVDTALAFIGQLKSNPDSAAVPAIVTFYTLISQGSGPFTYSYDFGDGNQTPNGTNQESHTYQTAGSYIATVTVTNARGVSYELSTTVLVVDTNDLSILLSDLAIDADLMEQILVAGDMESILADAQDIIDTALSSISNADEALKNSVKGSVQSDAGDLIANTRDQLDGFIENNQVQQEDVENIAQGVSDVISNMVKNSLPVLETTLADLVMISGDIFTATVETLLADENLTSAQIDEIKTSKDKAKEFFQTKEYLLDDVVDMSGIKVDVTTDFNVGDINTLASNHGLTDQQTAKLFNSVESTLNVDQTIALSSVSNQTIAQIVEAIINTYSGKTISESTIEPITKNILMEFTDGTYISFLVKSISIVEDNIPRGIFDLPDDTKLGITDSYAVKFVSYPVFPFDFAAEVIKLGIDPALKQDGSLSAGLSDDTKLSTRTGWEYFQNNSSMSRTTSFSITGGSDPSAEAYTLMVTYDTGSSQLIPPSVEAMDALTEALDSLVPADYSINNDTGVITIGTLNLKPDYVFTSLTGIDYNSITSMGGYVYNNLAFEIMDFNGDGVSDIKYYSDNPMGCQILYSVSN